MEAASLAGDVVDSVIEFIGYGCIVIYVIMLPSQSITLENTLPTAYRSSVAYFWINVLRRAWFTLAIGLAAGGLLLGEFALSGLSFVPSLVLTEGFFELTTFVSLAPLLITGLLTCLGFFVFNDAYHLLATANLRALDGKNRAGDLTK